MFVAVAAAGMLASCSSDSLTAGPDPKIEPTQEERVPIEIGVATAQTKAVTRGIGTVGGTDDTPSTGDNYWQAEKVNVFMFNQNSLNLALEDPEDANSALYDNTELTTPESAAQMGGGSNTNKGIAYEITAGRVKYKYYPVTGNFDFWGYYADDAATGAPARDAAAPNTTKITVPFTINGTQDLMVAKAKPTDAQQDIIDDDAFGTDKTRYYSAFSARKNVQPEMSFNHLLTRLTFSVLAGNEKTRGWKESAPGAGDWAKPADGKPYEGVFIKSIKVRSLKTGEIIVAYTGANKTLPELISFTESTPAAPADSAWFDLKGLRNDPAATVQTLDPLYDPAVFEIAGDPAPWTTDYLTTNKLLLWNDGGTGDNANWGKIWRPKTLATAPLTPNPDGDPIGGAILVAPEEPSFIIKVELGQYLLDSEDAPAGSGTNQTFKVKYTTFEREITPTSGTKFDQKTSYNVKMTLYGFERIEITTKLEPWLEGDDVEFGVE